MIWVYISMVWIIGMLATLVWAAVQIAHRRVPVISCGWYGYTSHQFQTSSLVHKRKSFNSEAGISRVRLGTPAGRSRARIGWPCRMRPSLFPKSGMRGAMSEVVPAAGEIIILDGTPIWTHATRLLRVVNRVAICSKCLFKAFPDGASPNLTMQASLR